MDTMAERIEYKLQNGRYTEWTAIDEPPYGEVILRVTVRVSHYCLLPSIFQD